MNRIGLVSTLHDPDGKMAAFIPGCLPHLNSLYAAISVVATGVSSAETLTLLHERGIRVFQDGSAHIGVSRRLALQYGLDDEEIEYLHYCDFDRVLHWTLHYPQELVWLGQKTIPGADYLIIGRTERAFDTHPVAQIENEKLTNAVFSHLFGSPVDVTAGSCSLSRAVAEIILAHSVELSNATDCEWPMIMHCLPNSRFEVGFVAVEGLEFETVTFYGQEVFQLSDTPQNWLRRVRLSRESVQAAMRVQRQFVGMTTGF